jgi:uncharacterized protein YndB with AHSA1/START domain
VIRIEHGVAIDRPPAEVFAYVSDPANLPAWQGSCVAATADGPVAVGTRIMEKRRFLGREATTVVEVTEIEPDRLLMLDVVDGPVSFTVTHRLVPEGGGTRLTISAEGEPGGLLRLGSRLLVRAVDEETRTNLERLKELLETRPAAPPGTRSG